MQAGPKRIRPTTREELRQGSLTLRMEATHQARSLEKCLVDRWKLEDLREELAQVKEEAKEKVAFRVFEKMVSRYLKGQKIAVFQLASRGAFPRSGLQ